MEGVTRHAQLRHSTDHLHRETEQFATLLADACRGTANAATSYLAEHSATVARQSHELADTEADLNARVYRLFHLTPDEIKLLQREVEH